MEKQIEENTRPAVMTLDQLNGSVNALLCACDTALHKQALADADGPMMQMMLLSFTLGALISTCPSRELVIAAALDNIKKGVAYAAANPQLQHVATLSGVVH
ncbi:hypothetical protein [Duganella vulcania]|uniref:Uncharacterized protein n=1 Tax=Duganella vulcania TaxID=2692166 RepID=A0A845GH75_9BURK|nr:hypothetical protein [Duganella vulcania]MYM92755.1 hypothetical protein [Duganella vulcania]